MLADVSRLTASKRRGLDGHYRQRRAGGPPKAGPAVRIGPGAPIPSSSGRTAAFSPPVGRAPSPEYTGFLVRCAMAFDPNHALAGVDGASLVATRYWHPVTDGRVQCDVCPRHCRMHDGQRGMCFVRACHGGEIVLTTYGRSSGFCVDPIEKKPLNHFLPGTPVLSFGTAGCNLACRFCQNWDISKSREIETLADAASPDAIAARAVVLGCRSVAFTYNDPVIFMEYAIDVAIACRARGIRAVAVTAGYMDAEPRAEFYRHMDAANVDLKAFTESFYRDVCAGHLQPVLETLEYLKHETQVWFEITNLMIPGLNDSEQETDALTRWVVERLGPDVPLHFTAFHPDWKMRDRPPTPPDTLRRARQIALENGVRYAYTGNVHDAEGGTTFCHRCGAPLIVRDWYTMLDWRLTSDGRCVECGARCTGVFDGPPGAWGSRRRRIWMETP
jgi:pyruvate formate lyase activating enzyme